MDSKSIYCGDCVKRVLGVNGCYICTDDRGSLLSRDEKDYKKAYLCLKKHGLYKETVIAKICEGELPF